jgi:hypothetical protein
MTGMVALLAQRGVPSADNFQLAGVSLRPDYLDAAHVALVATPMDRQLGIAGAELLLDIINGKPERSEPVNVGAARFVSPSFPYLVHPKNTGSGGGLRRSEDSQSPSAKAAMIITPLT